MKMGASDFKAKHGPSRFRRNNRARRTRVGRDADPEGFRDLATRLPIDVAQHQHGRSAASNSSRTGSPVSADSRRRIRIRAQASLVAVGHRVQHEILTRCEADCEADPQAPRLPLDLVAAELDAGPLAA